MPAKLGEDRIEGGDASADPVGKRRDVELDAFPGEGGALAVQRQMVAELADQDHGEQARAGEAARNRMRRRRRLADRLAVPAGELLAHPLDDLPAPRLAFERLGHDLAELAQPRAAALAADARGGLDDAFDRQVLRQPARSALRMPALRPGGLRLRGLCLGLFLGLRLFQLLDRQFELLDEELAALRRLPVGLAARPGQLQLQPLDLEGADFRFALRGGEHLALGEDHRVRARQIARKDVRQAIGRMFARACHDDDENRFGGKSRLRNRTLSQSAAVIRPPWDARFSAAFASQCQTTDRRAARLKSSRRRRRPRATGTVRARAASRTGMRRRRHARSA